MFDTSLQDVQFVGGYYNEYLNQINRYKNLKRPSIFCRYLKLNKDASTFHPETEGTHDRFYSGILYDSYEYTPAYSVSPLINNSVDDQSKKGRMFDGSLEIVVYTIDQPTHNDLVLFPYSPNNPNGEIFRVKDINVSLNSLNKNIKYSKLTLEKAPVEQNKLKYLNTYVYLMTKELYVPAQKYARIVKEYELFKQIFELLSTKFDSRKELYYYEYNNFKISPLKENKIIYDFLTSPKNNERYFTNAKIPLGILEYENHIFDEIGLDLKTNKLIEMDGTNNPVLLGFEEYLNDMLFNLPWKIEFYHFIDGRFKYSDKLPSEYTADIINYQINELTLLIDLAALIPHFKG
ncbi:MAG: hypothetical protein H7836_04780 [Magnetococcus sp. YQC-3]